MSNKQSRNGSSTATIEEAVETSGKHVALYLPISKMPETTWGIHVDTRLTPKQSRALRSIAAGLDRQQATLESGSRVVSSNDALKYLLEQVALAPVGS